jgi:putative ABC transport system permease protein
MSGERRARGARPGVQSFLPRRSQHARVRRHVSVISTGYARPRADDHPSRDPRPVLPRRRLHSLTFMATSAWSALGRHRMRAALTVLGIAIGVGAVITMVSLGRGANQILADRLESMGPNVLYIEARDKIVQGAMAAADTLMFDDVVAMRKECPEVVLASPHVNFRAQIVAGGQNWNTNVRGVDPEFQNIRRWPMADGSFLNPQQVEAAAKVAVLGKTVLNALFPPNSNAVGATIRINAAPFTVIGVLAGKGAGVVGEDQDDVIVIPWTTAQRKMLGIRHLKDIWAAAASRETLPAAKRQITALLRQRHRLTADQPDDHTIRDYTEIAEASSETNAAMTLLLSAVASLALLVGGINTMSIMLVTVTERTREIGIRMAVGARVRDIRLQFLCEALLLTILGGVSGVAFGVGVSRAFAELFGWATVISADTVAIGLGVSTAVGLLFGSYPAVRASLLDPIEAIRSD